MAKDYTPGVSLAMKALLLATHPETTPAACEGISDELKEVTTGWVNPWEGLWLLTVETTVTQETIACVVGKYLRQDEFLLIQIDPENLGDSPKYLFWLKNKVSRGGGSRQP